MKLLARKRDFGKNYFTSNKISKYGNYQTVSNYKLHRDLMDLVRSFKTSGRLLEIGCAYGFFLRYAEKYFNTYGIDISSYAINHAREITSRSKLVVGDVEEKIKGYPDGFFDVIIGIDVMEHLRNPSAVLSEIHKKMKENGVFIFRVPNKNSIMFFILKTFGLKKCWCGLQDKTHISLFSNKEWKKIAIKNNFEIEIYSVVPTIYLRNILDKLGTQKVFYKNIFRFLNENVVFVGRK